MQAANNDQLLSTITELKRALQDAHFAIRELEALLPPSSAALRPADRVHALRVQAGELNLAIRRAMAELPLAA